MNNHQEKIDAYQRKLAEIIETKETDVLSQRITDEIDELRIHMLKDFVGRFELHAKKAPSLDNDGVMLFQAMQVFQYIDQHSINDYDAKMAIHRVVAAYKTYNEYEYSDKPGKRAKGV